MDVSNDNDNQQENTCFVCQKIGSSFESRSDLGEIIKVMRGLPTLKTVRHDAKFCRKFVRKLERTNERSGSNKDRL
jgi:hypothetical protein